MVRLSVLIPVYRGSVHLEPLLETLCRDTYLDKEVVVVADVQLPETLRLKERHPEARFIFNKERLGKVNALNATAPQTYRPRCTGVKLKLPSRRQRKIKVTAHFM